MGHRPGSPDGTGAATVRSHDHPCHPTVGGARCCRRRRRHAHLHHVRGGRRPTGRERYGGHRPPARATPPRAGTGRPAGEPHLAHPPAGRHAHRDHPWHRRPRPVLDGRGHGRGVVGRPRPRCAPAGPDRRGCRPEAGRPPCCRGLSGPGRGRGTASIGGHRGRHAGAPGPGRLLPDQGRGRRRPQPAGGLGPPRQHRLHRLGRAGRRPRAVAAQGGHRRPPTVPRPARRVVRPGPARPRDPDGAVPRGRRDRRGQRRLLRAGPGLRRSGRPGGGRGLRRQAALGADGRSPRAGAAGGRPAARRSGGCRGRARSCGGAGRRPWTGSTGCRA